MYLHTYLSDDFPFNILLEFKLPKGMELWKLLICITKEEFLIYHSYTNIKYRFQYLHIWLEDISFSFAFTYVFDHQWT